ncbi:MAG: hypothetical protein MJH10_10670 [Epibacterium sp.]|nr:hypothetical protein [Epibacterium sp.]NQX74004.1 glycosyltransferase family 2 protein [Epibacterium sp.]
MITLQNFITPDPEVCTERDLYLHAQGAYGFATEAAHYVLMRGAELSFDSYFNLLNLATWHQNCHIKDLFMEISGRGRVALRIYHEPEYSSRTEIYSDVITLDLDHPHQVNLTACLCKLHNEAIRAGIVYVSLTALEDEVQFSAGRFAIPQLPAGLELPRLAISITTFRRETEVQRTVARLEAFLQQFAYGDHIRVQVVDNGQSADIPASDRVIPIPNANLGGSGGFARGLLQAEESGASHCLFMDDDASFDMENIARSYMFLALAHDPKTAVAGAMISNTQKWRMWENGAWFNGSCRPLWNGTDLRRADKVIAMEHRSNQAVPGTIYGGWWFFAFPVAAVTRYPFPFFVRGDDINFSLANDFRIRTLSGVVSFQDDFTEKESPQTLYLDLRNHLVQHLTIPDLRRSALGIARIAIFFVLRSLFRMHYSTAMVQLMAWEDVIEGPSFFDRNIDMSARRAKIKDMSEDEAWRPVAEMDLSEHRRGVAKLRHKRRHRWGMRSLNGHLWPFYRGSRLVLPISKRALVGQAFGATQITYLNTRGDKAYRVVRSRRRFANVLWKMAKLTWRFWRHFDQIQKAYDQDYKAMSSKAYWQDVLKR